MLSTVITRGSRARGSSARGSRARVFPINSRTSRTSPRHINIISTSSSEKHKNHLNNLNPNVMREVLQKLPRHTLASLRGTSTSMRNVTKEEMNNRNKQVKIRADLVSEKVLKLSFRNASAENKKHIKKRITSSIRRQLNKTRNTTKRNANLYKKISSANVSDVSDAFQALKDEPWNLSPMQIARSEFRSRACLNIDNAHMKSFSIACAYGALAHIDRLDLYHNKIGDTGMKAFSGALASGALANLKKLYLSRNNIGDAGIIAFSGAIATGALDSVIEFRIEVNKITRPGMFALSRALASGAMRSLKTLYAGITGETSLQDTCDARGINLLNGIIYLNT